MQDFSVERSTKSIGDPIFEGRNKILLLSKDLKFGIKFSKICSKINKNLKTMGKIKKNAFSKKNNFARDYGEK